MGPEELIRKLEELGVSSSRSTLTLWVRRGLIPAPATRSLGRGRGSESVYPRAAVGEAYAAAWLMREKRMRASEVRDARRLVYEYAKAKTTDPHQAAASYLALFADRHPATTWAIRAAKVNAGWGEDQPAAVRVIGLDDEGCVAYEVTSARLTRVPPPGMEIRRAVLEGLMQELSRDTFSFP